VELDDSRPPARSGTDPAWAGRRGRHGCDDRHTRQHGHRIATPRCHHRRQHSVVEHFPWTCAPAGSEGAGVGQCMPTNAPTRRDPCVNRARKVLGSAMAIFERSVGHARIKLYYELEGDGFPVLAIAPGGLRSAATLWRDRPIDPSFLVRDYRII